MPSDIAQVDLKVDPIIVDLIIVVYVGILPLPLWPRYTSEIVLFSLCKCSDTFILEAGRTEVC